MSLLSWRLEPRVLCLAAAVALGATGASVASDSVSFAALHTYYISPTGNDRNSGTSPNDAWASPRHPVQCGDVIIAAAGRYRNHVFGTRNWGVVSSCPSTEGGIDGKGGVFFATLLCAGPDITSCSVDGGAYEAFRVDASNWAVEGFTATQNSTGNSACYSATSETEDTLHHIAFINDIAVNCHYSGFNSYAWTSPGGVDQTAVVGVISYDSSRSLGGGICSSGVSIIPTDGPDTSPGTHIFVAGYFGYRNVNAPVGAGCNTDGEGLVFDSWSCTNYGHQGVAEQNVWWGNGNAGFEVFPNCLSNGDKARIYAFGNTSYGNAQDPKHQDPTAELYLNQISPRTGGGRYEIYRNIFVATERTSGNNSRSPVYAASVYLKDEDMEAVSIHDNIFWQSNPGARTGPGNPNTDVYVAGAHNRTSFPFGTNAYRDPGLANPAGLPTSAPDCAGYASTTACMNERYRVAANLTPGGSAAGIGYRAPGPCAPDPYFPAWLKGVVYLHRSESGLTEEGGLITKPCGL